MLSHQQSVYHCLGPCDSGSRRVSGGAGPSATVICETGYSGRSCRRGLCVAC